MAPGPFALNNSPPFIALPSALFPPPDPLEALLEPVVFVDEEEGEERIPASFNVSPSLATRTLSSSSAVESNRPFA